MTTYTAAEAYEMAQDYHNKLVEQEFDQAKKELENLIDSAIKKGKFTITTELIQTNDGTIVKLVEYFDNLGYLTTSQISGRIYNSYAKEIENSYFITIRWDASAQLHWETLTAALEEN